MTPALAIVFERRAVADVETMTPPICSPTSSRRDRVLVVGFAKGKVKATNKTFEDHWVFAMTVRNRKVTNIREYVDTQALARASDTDTKRNHS
jgi:ketosteroid isomerase-like protein